MSADALKLTVYVGERARTDDGRLAADALMEIAARHELRVSALLRGTEGFGPKHRLRTDRAAAATTILDDDALPEPLLERLADHRKHRLDESARAGRDDQTHRPVRPVLRVRDRRDREQQDERAHDQNFGNTCRSASQRDICIGLPTAARRNSSCFSLFGQTC